MSEKGLVMFPHWEVTEVSYHFRSRLIVPQGTVRIQVVELLVEC